VASSRGVGARKTEIHPRSSRWPMPTRKSWADQVAEDRRLAEDRRDAQPAHRGGGM